MLMLSIHSRKCASGRKLKGVLENPQNTSWAAPPTTGAVNPVQYPSRLERGDSPSGTGTSEASGSYRLRGLDGMRALAALAVLVYHVAPNWMPGGFLGVDVFFVLSGFLITALLAQESRRFGAIRVRRFWMRRFRRLFPAVALAVLVTVPIAALVNRDFLVGIGRQVAGSLTFTYNWVNIASGSSYFDRANPQFLSNMWTLAVEQQFYVLWPLVLALILMLPQRIHWLAPLALTAFSVVEMGVLKTLGVSLTRVYEGTDSHAFGMMLGASLALFFPFCVQRNEHFLDRPTVTRRGLGAWIGFIGIIISFFTLRDTDPFTYPFGVLAVSVLTLAVIQACFEEVSGPGGPGRILVELLEWRPLVWLGERSYSLYLWHWPVFLLVMTSVPGWPEWLELVVIAVISITAAHLSYTYVESPMRYRGIVSTWKGWFTKLFSRGENLTPVLAPETQIPPDGSTQEIPVLRRASRRPALIAALAAVVLVVPLGTAIALAPTRTEAEILVAQGAKYLREKSSQKRKTEPSAKPSEKTSPDSSAAPKASATPSPVLTPVPVTGDQVDIIGDSVTLAAAPSLAELLPGASIDGEVSRSSAAGLHIVESMLAAGTLRPYLVFSLATNSAFRDADAEALLQMLPTDTKVVFVTGHGQPSQQWITESNQTMYSMAGKYPKRVKVAAWDQAIANHPEMLAGDQVHPQPSGQRLYAQLIYQALQELAPLQGAPSNTKPAR